MTQAVLISAAQSVETCRKGILCFPTVRCVFPVHEMCVSRREMTLSEIGTHFVTYIYYYCAHLSLSLPEAVHNLLSRFLCVYTVSFRVQR